MIGIGSKTGWRTVVINGEQYNLINKKDRRKLRAELGSSESLDELRSRRED